MIWFYFLIYIGKYYLGDVGYDNKNEIFSPYRSVQYHLKEFSDRPPENAQKLFNLQHSFPTRRSSDLYLRWTPDVILFLVGDH